MASPYVYTEARGGLYAPPDSEVLIEELVFWSQKRAHTRVIVGDVDYMGAVLDDERRVIAGVVAHKVDDRGWVDALFTLGERQGVAGTGYEGQGIGALLLGKVLDAPVLQPISRLGLTPHYASVEFYENLGFVQVNPGDIGTPLEVEGKVLRSCLSERQAIGRLAGFTSDQLATAPQAERQGGC